MLDVWYQASLVAHSFLTEEFLATERRQVAEHWLPMAETMVYETEGRVVGFLALIGNEVGAVFVDPNFQRRGIGRALMDRARDSRPFLELNVLEANDPMGHLNPMEDVPGQHQKGRGNATCHIKRG